MSLAPASLSYPLPLQLQTLQIQYLWRSWAMRLLDGSTPCSENRCPSMANLRIGVIGGGGIAAAHLPRLKQRSDEVTIVGIADPGPKAADTAGKFGIKRLVADHRELLPDVDAVLVCVPTHLHAPIAIDALRGGKHVFVEKPITRTAEQAEQLREAIASSGKALQVGFVRRFDEEWLVWRQAILDGRIGRPVIWRDIQAVHWPTRPWFVDEAQGGGPFLDGCIHNYDFALHTFGPAEWAFAHLRTMVSDRTAFDTGTATIRFRSGDELLLAWSWGLAEGCRGGRVFEMLGPDGTLTWPPDDPNLTQGRIILTRPREKQDLRFTPGSLFKGFDNQMDEFIYVCHGRKQPQAGWQEGRDSLAVALAVLESARSGRRVDIM
jgi:predicted dehydrogenase